MAIDILYTEIGRGHPFYLDGVRACLPETVSCRIDTVQACSRGLSQLGWHLARHAYTLGSSTSGGALYSRLRAGQHRAQKGPLAKLLCRDVIRRYETRDTPLLVAHPILVNALKNRPQLYYQHGEVVAPPESLIAGAYTAFVPTSDVADQFISAGMPATQICVTGLCIENSLRQNASRCFDARQARLKANAPLTCALYASGAEPRPHVASLTRFARAAMQAGHRLAVFCKHHGALHQAMRTFENEFEGQYSVATHSDRASLNTNTSSRFPDFDVLIAPSHERSNWALGLGLPMCILGPCIGTFAPRNRDLLHQAGVACDMPEGTTADVGRWFSDVHESGALATMSSKGWGEYAIDGFNTIASRLMADTATST
ncbi:MAG: hypothetical protein OSB41_05570 [Kiritimatiellae bacterium]|nr:hypothetical protein [Kiritimatiellia bacterium]